MTDIEEERQRVVQFLERQLFSGVEKHRADECSHLLWDMWLDLKKEILSGDYRFRAK
jgi:hypothetical protein